MKTVNNSGNMETARRVLDSFQVLIIGLLLPFLFLVGINTQPHDSKANNSHKTEVSQPTYMVYSNGLIDYSSVLSDKNG